ncbi:site-specific integrase [Thiomonas sp. X19]|uniref:tyrosine-type recombinase/integrase n=1 Tax=Thiomonas sp. X19 TaxID=1050370 RepID=UPI00131488FD|nr:site-specific integrase [Thiomonas sp. X19]
MLTKTFELKADAERWARKIEREMDTGEWRDTRQADGMTVKELIGRYQAEVTPTKKGADREVFRLRVLLRAKLAGLAVSRVRSADVAEFRNLRTKDGASANTVRNDLNTLSAVFEWARSDLSFTVENPVRAVKKPSPGRGRERRLQGGEEQTLLDACSPGMRALVIVALETGMRLGELCVIERQHVDLKRRVARLLDSKNGAARDVPLSSAAVAAIQALPSALRGPVFGIASRSATAMFSRTCKRVGIAGLRFHDLRHEAMSRLAERGDFNVLELAAISGHKSLSMLKRYTHIEAEKLAKKLG